MILPVTLFSWLPEAHASRRWTQSVARYNRTSYFYPTFSESSEHSHLLVSPVLVASAVIGVVIILSCITIIVGSIRRDRQARLQRHRHRRHHHRHRRRRRRRHGEYDQGYVSDGHTYGRPSHRMRYACSPAEDWPPPLDLSSDGDVDATVLRELYPDSPPGYEECVGPGATQLYVPTDAPPPYSLTDSCPELDGILDAGSGHSPGRHQQVQRPQGQSGLRTVSMDTLPPYEAVCGASPPSGRLPLPGPQPGPQSSQGSLTPIQAPASGPERIMWLGPNADSAPPPPPQKLLSHPRLAACPNSPPALRRQLVLPPSTLRLVVLAELSPKPPLQATSVGQDPQRACSGGAEQLLWPKSSDWRPSAEAITLVCVGCPWAIKHWHSAFHGLQTGIHEQQESLERGRNGVDTKHGRPQYHRRCPPKTDQAGGTSGGRTHSVITRDSERPIRTAMSWPWAPGPNEDALETLLEDLISFYLDRAGEGQLGVCRQAALTSRAQQLLDTGPPLQLYLPEEVAPDSGAPCSAQQIDHKLVQALEFLELVSIHLLLFPWRKEIRSLKTYTGSFAYWVRPVLSEHTLHTLLGRLGYVATSEVEFSLVQAISEEDTKQMVFEIFLTRVACEAILRTPGRQLLGPGRERVSRPHHRPGSETGLQETLWEAQPGPDPSAGVGTESALAKHPDAQCSLPVVLNLPEVSTAPQGLLTGPLVPMDSLRRASTRSDSEEFLTCYSDLALHRTPLLPWDQPWSSLEGKQLQGPGTGPSPALGEVAATSGSSSEQPWVPNGASECKGATVSSQLRQRSGPCLSENSLAPKPDALPDLAALGMDTEPPSASSEMDELCEHFTHHLRTSTPAGYLGDTPGPRVEEEGQSEPLVGPEPAREGGSLDGR
ncbi:protein BEAN1 [Moschus berezovskii]|uniref:protein BEAN1 n=1 Tax=Moschus berezovskii TaxID=68408 RepID=UPI0024445C5A|nr:protein BEAN1 [Moschus berezovskii]